MTGQSLVIGQKYLVTVDNWFFAPDGEQYRAVFGTFHGVVDSESVLGIRTNAKSTNWYAVIGDVVVAGCQIHYVVKCDSVSSLPPEIEIEHNGQRFVTTANKTRIYQTS